MLGKNRLDPSKDAFPPLSAKTGDKVKTHTLVLGTKDRNGNAVVGQSEFEHWALPFLRRQLPENSFRLSMSNDWDRMVTVKYTGRQEELETLNILRGLKRRYCKKFKFTVGHSLIDGDGKKITV